jgi:hypothetical protein
LPAFNIKVCIRVWYFKDVVTPLKTVHECLQTLRGVIGDEVNGNAATGEAHHL